MTRTTGDTPEARAKDAALPGNHGQFGESTGTDDCKPLQDVPAAPVPPLASEPQLGEEDQSRKTDQ